jgi:hypothetical protein
MTTKATFVCKFLVVCCFFTSFCGAVSAAPEFDKETIARLQAAIDKVAAEKSMIDDFCSWYADQSMVTATIAGSLKEQELLNYVSRANAAFARLGLEFSEAHKVVSILYAANANDPNSQDLVASYIRLTELCPKVGS